MYFIALLIFIVAVFATFLFASDPSYYLDPPTLIILITIFFPMMFTSGLFKPLRNAFSLTISKNNNLSITELKKSYNAVVLAIKLISVSGIILTMIGVIALLGNFDDPYKLGPALSVALLSIFYTLITIIIFLPVQYCVKSMIDEKLDS